MENKKKHKNPSCPKNNFFQKKYISFMWSYLLKKEFLTYLSLHLHFLPIIIKTKYKRKIKNTLGGNKMKNYIKLDRHGEFVILYGFEKLKEQAYCYYSPVSFNMIALANEPQYNDCCYAIYAKRVNEDYSLIYNEQLYKAVLEGKLENKEFIWVKHTSCYILAATN